MIWTSDPVRDAERYYEEQENATREWQLAHYRGCCPICGEWMFEGSEDCEEDCMEHGDYPEGWVHIICQEIKEEDELEEAAELERQITEAEEVLAS